MKEKIAIIGAGISGLTCGFSLMQNKYENFEIFESSKVPGGVIKTFRNSKYLFEEGPNTFSLSDKRVLNMINSLKLKVIKPKDSSNVRYILKNDNLEKLPTTIFSIFTKKFLSKKSKFKILKEVFNRKNESSTNESIYDFFKRRFNKEIVEYIVNPFIAGTFSGDPKKISAKHAFPNLIKLENDYKSIILGSILSKSDRNKIPRQIISFKNGLTALPEELSKKFEEKIYFNTTIKTIKKVSNGFTIDFAKDGRLTEKNFNKIIITTPAHKIGKILSQDTVFSDLKKIESIYYPPLVTVTLSYNKKETPQIKNGFGMLVPEIEKKNILGVLYLSSMFADRAPKNETLITIFLGGSRQPALANLSDDEILKVVKSDLENIYAINSNPKFISIKRWKHSIPQYSVDYDDYLKAFDNIEEKLSGIYFTGNYKDGISIENNILNAMKLVNKIIN